MKPYLLGVDGGGSKTQACLADLQGNILGSGFSESSNYHVIGVASASTALRQAVLAAFNDAGVPAQRNWRDQFELILTACFGIAGIGRPDDQALLKSLIDKEWPGLKALLVSDAELVLAAGSDSGWGVALISGTGSLAYGRDRYGRTARAGGWGYILGDEGSGFNIGLAALRWVVRAHDGRAASTQLSEAILRHWKLAGIDQLIHFIYQSNIPIAEIAALAPLVETAGLAGDMPAQEIMTQAGNELAIAVRSVTNQLELDETIPCAMAGGVLTHSQLVAGAFLSEAASLGLRLNPIIYVNEPVQGAIKLAQRAAQFE
jgi:N-acetylglucosamine kinase-like BadF-type ATPase